MNAVMTQAQLLYSEWERKPRNRVALNGSPLEQGSRRRAALTFFLSHTDSTKRDILEASMSEAERIVIETTQHEPCSFHTCGNADYFCDAYVLFAALCDESDSGVLHTVRSITIYFDVMR